MIDKEEEKVLFDLKRVPLASEREEIRNRHRSYFLVFLLCLFFLILGILLGHLFLPKERSNSVDSHSSLSEIQQIMGKYWLYGDQYEDLGNELEEKAMYGMTSFDFDPYTSYMSAEEMNTFSDSINRSYVGIGVEYANTSDAALIVKVFKSSPAEKAGLKAGDRIIEVDGTSVGGLSNEEIRSLVLGEEGTIVTLKIERDGQRLDVDVTRGVVSSTVYAYIRDGVIVMEIDSFGENTAEEVSRYLDEYLDYDKIIIDLRNDTGGYQTAVRDISGFFIGPGEVYLRQKDVNGVEMVDVTPSRIGKYDNLKKVVVLTSRDTASAAEVLTIVLKEKCDAIIVGETTYGKGVIQTNRFLSNGGVLKLTTYYWLSPDGVSIDKTGIEPDYEVKMPDIYYQYYFDMEEDEAYEPDSVSDSVLWAQMAMDYLGYDIERTDGYFDRSFAEALISFRGEHGMSAIAVLDRDAFSAIIAETRSELASNSEKDMQLLKALEVINED